MRISISSYRYQSVDHHDEEISGLLLELAEKHPAYGFAKLFHLIRNLGHRWNHKRIHRIYCALSLNIRRKGKKRLPNRHPQPLDIPACENISWSMDFMSDALSNGRRFRTFNIIDDYSREILAIEIDLSLPTKRIIRVLDRLVEYRGCPKKIRMDNGPEFISVHLADWAERNGISLEFIQPGRPMQNGYIERFNRSYRTEILDRYLFRTLDEVRSLTADWMVEYNEIRPHESLGNLPPKAFLKKKQGKVSNLTCY